MDRGRFLAEGQQLRSGDYRSQVGWFSEMGSLENLQFIFLTRIAYCKADHKTVGLGFWELLRAGRAYRILCSHYNERLRDVVRVSINGNTSFLHDFQQRGLRFRGRAVDFIGQQELVMAAPGT